MNAGVLLRFKSHFVQEYTSNHTRDASATEGMLPKLGSLGSLRTFLSQKEKL